MQEYEANEAEKRARHGLLVAIQIKAERLAELCQSIRELTCRIDNRYTCECVTEYLQKELAYKQNSYKIVVQGMKDLLES
jgi:hypothetical protein